MKLSKERMKPYSKYILRARLVHNMANEIGTVSNDVYAHVGFSEHGDKRTRNEVLDQIYTSTDHLQVHLASQLKRFILDKYETL